MEHCKKISLPKDIPFVNMKNYFDIVYEYIQKETENYPTECFTIYNLYDNLIKKSEQFVRSKRLMNNTVSLIQTPTINAEYHFIVVVIYNDMCSIYQAYGNRKIYKIQLELTEFIECIRKIKQILSTKFNKKNKKNIEKDIQNIRAIEKLLYDNDIDAGIRQMIHKSKEDDDEEDDDEEGLFIETLEDLYQNNWKTIGNKFSIRTYKLNKRSRTKSLSIKKTKSKRITRKYKSL
jgi:tRNA G10  N-methylase Trm11